MQMVHQGMKWPCILDTVVADYLRVRVRCEEMGCLKLFDIRQADIALLNLATHNKFEAIFYKELK